jgi:hypothetical protein
MLTAQASSCNLSIHCRSASKYTIDLDLHMHKGGLKRMWTVCSHLQFYSVLPGHQAKSSDNPALNNDMKTTGTEQDHTQQTSELNQYLHV